MTRAALATAFRVLRQLRRDPRTLVLLLGVPSFLLWIVKEVLSGQEETFARVGAPMVGLFPFTTMFVVTSVTMVRERTTGTLERLMTLPLTKLDVLAGYAAAFTVAGAAQAAVTFSVGFGLLGIDSAGPLWVVFLLAVANALLGMALGLFTSAFATTEFQAVQFLPAFVFPQVLLCGLFVPRERMGEALEAISAVLPFTYAYDGIAQATGSADLDARIGLDASVVVGVMLLALALGAATLRRRTP